MVRTFICVEITDKEILYTIENTITRLKKIQGVKPAKPTQMHLTLKFLGEITETQIEQIKEILDLWKEKRFDLSLEEVGCFPNLKQIRVIWMGIQEGKEILIQLAKKINEELKPIGIPAERRSYIPHLTLARVKYLKNQDKDALIRLIKELEFIKGGKQTINEIILMKSTLTPNGAIYEKLYSVLLS